MNRREFLRDSALALTGLLICGPLGATFPRGIPDPPLRLALLADAHLRDGDEGRPEARRLAQAVAEIESLRPHPDLVLFAGDLAHHGHPGALGLGREILSALPVSLLAVRGEGDLSHGSPQVWETYFGKVPFFYEYRGVYFLGLNTSWQPAPSGPAFFLGEAQRRWLGQILPALSPEKPLVVLSHAPLPPIFRPWGQWTTDAAALTPLLGRFRQVVLLHGHVHHLRIKGKKTRGGHEVRDWDSLWPAASENRKLEAENLSLPATAWPYPWALEGTPDELRPGLAPRGCGWLALSASAATGWQVCPYLWET